jgi:septum site-determining protein MinD
LFSGFSELGFSRSYYAQYGGNLMAGKVIVITSGKGGVGKTTTCANLGTGLALRGRRTVLIDADVGLRNLDVVMGLENRIVFDLVNVVEKVCKTRQALIKDKRFENLYLLPAAQTKEKDAVKPEQMVELCNELRQEFDYILIDCPAGIEQGFKNAVAGAEQAVLVTTPDVSAVRDADRIIGLLQSRGITEPRLIVNRVRPEMVRRGDMMDVNDVNDILAINLIGVVPDDEGIIISTNKGEPAVLDSNSKAGTAFRNIVARLEGEEVPFMPLDYDLGIFDKLKRLIK